MKRKGGPTRVHLLRKLSTPKDRFQLAKDLDLDWKVVDQHMRILRRQGFVQEQVAYGRVKLFTLTSSGKELLDVFGTNG